MSMRRENSRTRGDYPNINGIVRRMVSLPRNILGGFSRAMGNGFNMMGISDRRTQIFPPISPSNLPPTQFPMLSPQFEQDNAMMIDDEWAFLNNFEQNFGVTHPFFYACKLTQALKIAQDEKKLLFLYLHSPDHPFTAEFCRETLCSEIVVQFLDANFVSWGGISDRGEGLQMSGSLRPASFPFCAVIAPASDDNIAVLQQIEGPVSPAELVEILQGTLEEQGVAFGSSRAKEEEKTRLDRRLREQQDDAYQAALKLDQAKERHRNSPAATEQTVPKPVASSTSDSGFSQLPRNNPILNNKPGQVKECSTAKRENQHKGSSSKAKDNRVTQILIRFPNGERKECSFSATDKVKAIYKYIDSLNLQEIGSYRLISSFPRKVYGADQMSMTLKDVGLYPRASLFLDLS